MAKSKIITYDLRKAGRNYDELYKYLRSYTTLIAITESVWCVSTTKTCSEIRNELCAITDSNDGIFTLCALRRCKVSFGTAKVRFSLGNRAKFRF